jgi:hypothetical protein
VSAAVCECNGPEGGGFSARSEAPVHGIKRSDFGEGEYAATQ